MGLRQYILAIKKFNFDKGTLNASALTFYTMFALVPILATSIGVTRGFGLEKFLNAQINKAFAGQEAVIDVLNQYAANLLAQSSNDVVAGVAVIILFYSVYSMLTHIEHSLNEIWQVTDLRATMRRVNNYLALIFIAPIILVVSGSLKILIIKALPESQIAALVGGFLSFLLITFLFYWLYKYMPNTRVKINAALFSAMQASIVYILLQSILIKSQLIISSYNAVYGSLAALPLFLVWVQASWIIVLFGAQLSFIYQNKLQHIWEIDLNNLSINSKQKLLVQITNLCIASFNTEQKSLTNEELSKKINLSMCITQQLLNLLLKAHILISTTKNNQITYLPAQNIARLNETYIANATNSLGINID